MLPRHHYTLPRDPMSQAAFHNPDAPEPADLPVEDFRAAMHRVADLAADYLANVEQYRVVPDIKPSDVRNRLPAAPPPQPEPLDVLLSDYQRLIEPNMTHWNHPGFMAYFAITGS